MDELYDSPVEQWTESMVGTWLKSIGIKEEYIKKLQEEEVNGQVLLEITEDFLKKETGMKSGPALLIIEKRKVLLDTVHKHQKQDNNACEKTAEIKAQDAGCIKDNPRNIHPQKEEIKEDCVTVLTVKKDSKPRPFGKNGTDYTYVKHDVLQPESGISDLINPCYEYKAFTIAATLDRQRLQAKLAKEVFKFATGCINIRTNGTIYFGIMDSRENSGYVHGEIIGVPIKERDMYADALDYIERSFSRNSDLVRQCIRPAQFIQVIQKNGNEDHYVVEFDVVPSFSIVKNWVISVRLPNFRENSNKVEFEKEVTFRRVGSKTEPVSDLNEFNQGICYRDAHRERAEQEHRLTVPELCQDLGRKLVMLVTSGKKTMDKEKWYILVTNKFQKEDLGNIHFLLNMKIFCVFDFDQDSNVSGLCKEYVKYHDANLHFMHNYKIPSGMSVEEFWNHLHLFEQPSWIFCNGRSDFRGSETCDENTWAKTKRTFLKDCVSLICKNILPKGTFLVIFLLTAPVETPILSTFYEFFTDMNGHEDIIFITESQQNFLKWQAFALQSCDMETVDKSSIVGLQMSHINATLQYVQTVTTTKVLPVYSKAKCYLEQRDEERMPSLEILSINQCEDTDHDTIESSKIDVERQFYHGGKLTWMNLWLAENKFVEEVIQREVYNEVTKLLNDSLQWSVDQMPISCINIYHHPGSGGSTVARQVLWNYRRKLRCAVVKSSYSVDTVTEHALELREYKEKDPHKCLPVLLLVEDCDKEYLEDLKNELQDAVKTKKIACGTPCFILLSCRRSNIPEQMCKESPLQNVSVTHKLSDNEKRQFARKRQQLEKQFQPEFILTFVLMSEEFEKDSIAKYVQQFVQNLLQDINPESAVTRLIHYVALFNTYVQTSFISRSHCEALLALSIHMDRFKQQTFESSLSEQGKLVFIHLRDERTHIESIRIIHPKVAEEILHQLLGDRQQSDLALDLLRNDVLFEHRFGREDYMKFLRALFMRRYRISKGDKSDSLFSPLIEHIIKKEEVEIAIELLKEVYGRFNRDAFFAQQLARLNYLHERFEEAEYWADIAVTKLPNNSYILDTKGQVYRRWFMAKCKSIEKIDKTAENTADAIETALKAIDCFQACEKTAVADRETMNLSGFFGEVEVGCNLLRLIMSFPMFSTKMTGRSEFRKYLLTDHIPKEIEKPWQQLHVKLKKLHATMHEALDWVSEDLSYFQRDLNTDEEDTFKSCDVTISHPKQWLVSKSAVYGKYFSEASLSTVSSQWQSNPDCLSSLNKRMIIYRLGGGNITTIFSILDQKDKDQVKTFEDITSLYPSNPLGARMDQVDFVNYTASHIALSTVSPKSLRLAAFSDLQSLSHQFLQNKPRCLASAQFLCMLLFWPEEHDSDYEKENKYEKVFSAVEFLQKSYEAKMKNILPRKRRIYTHFFLGIGGQYEKLVHKSKIETSTKLPLSEKRQKWIQGELLKVPKIAEMLKRVPGWTEDGTVYLEGPKKKKFPVHALHIYSVPNGNENVTFNLGFTFRGPVAYNIKKVQS